MRRGEEGRVGGWEGDKEGGGEAGEVGPGQRSLAFCSGRGLS